MDKRNWEYINQEQNDRDKKRIVCVRVPPLQLNSEDWKDAREIKKKERRGGENRHKKATERKESLRTDN